VGTAAKYQAIPFSPLIERAQSERGLAEIIPFFDRVSTMSADDHRFKDDPLWAEFGAIARAIVIQRPSILDRHVFTDAWDVIYWLLSPNRRANQPRDPAGLAERAIFGAETFNCGAESTIGIPLRFVSPTDADIIATGVADSFDTAFFDVAAMEASGVYKFRQLEDRPYVISLVEELAQLYRNAANENEYVLVSFD
jgi:hypothetical protein